MKVFKYKDGLLGMLELRIDEMRRQLCQLDDLDLNWLDYDGKDKLYSTLLRASIDLDSEMNKLKEMECVKSE